MTELVVLIGFPACGKSTYAKELKMKGYHIYSSDKLREEFYGDENIQGVANDIFLELTRRIKKDLNSGYSCVLDATNLNRKKRKNFLANFRNIKCVKRCVLFLVPLEECKRRNQLRDRTVIEEVFSRKKEEFQCPAKYEGWDEIEIQRMENLNYRFPFEQAMNFSQSTPFHSLTLGEHMQAAEAYCKQKDYSSQVQLAAKYHDCGKLYTQTFFNSKGLPSDRAHYYGHENYSAYLFLLEMFSQKENHLSKEEILYVANLINWHMNPHNSWKVSKKAQMRDRQLMGQEMYQDIMCLHEADVAAH